MTNPDNLQEIPCDLCGSAAQRLLFNRGRNDEAINNVICQQCGLVYVSPRPSQTDVNATYLEGNFSLAARGGHTPTPEKFVLSERAAFARFQALTQAIDLTQFASDSACLEIGCGVGSFLRFMHGAGWRVQGIEPDPNYAQAGESAYHVPILSTLYETTPFARESFALIASFHVLEHVPSPKAFLSKVYEELQPNGLLFLEVPCINRPYGGNLPQFFWSAHLFSFSVNTLTGYLQQAGFEVVWQGFAEHFLQIIARKIVPSTAMPPAMVYPLDDPNRLYRRTHQLYWWFQRQQRTPIRYIGKVVRGIRRSVNTIQEDPAEFKAGVQRLTRRLQVEVLGPKLARLPLPTMRPKYLTHFGTHVPGNAGDTLLLQAVRDVFDHVQGRNRWRLEPLWDEVTPQIVQRLNSRARGIVIGGGGLLLRDTNPNPQSGWQWHCSTLLMRQIAVPIIVFAIGYNRFRGQEDFAPVFRENITQLVSQSAFFSLRNYGSICALHDYLPPELHEKIFYQPCPTTVLRYFYPDYESALFAPDTPPRLALNVAFDRHQLRFAGREDEILTSIARAMRRAADQGWEIHLVLHSRDGDHVIPWLLRENVPYQITTLIGRPVNEILSFYQQISLAVGMRGHSQMIPFGQGVPIISLISHDKLRYFLEDIGHEEWGVDLHEPDLVERLTAAIECVANAPQVLQAQIWQAQQQLWQVTQHNLQLIQEALAV